LDEKWINMALARVSYLSEDDERLPRHYDREVLSAMGETSIPSAHTRQNCPIARRPPQYIRIEYQGLSPIGVPFHHLPVHLDVRFPQPLSFATFAFRYANNTSCYPDCNEVNIDGSFIQWSTECAFEYEGKVNSYS
jgi:hypothetical protein